MVKIKISEIKANPFKRFINEGKLDSERVDKLIESIEHGTLPAQFVARKNKAGEWEQTSGHHRLAAFKKKYGKDYEVDVTPVKFSDELMLIDMVRENITQRDTDFHDTEASIILARTWLESGASSVKELNTWFKDGRKSNAIKGKEKFQELPDSYRSVSKFLSKNGTVMSYVTVRKYINIHDKLSPKLHNKIETTKNQTNRTENKIGSEIAYEITKLPQDKQEEAYEQIIKQDMGGKTARTFISEYKKILEPEVVSEKEADEEPDETEELISFDKDFKRTANEYQNTLFLIKKITNKHYSNAELQLLIETIEDTIKEENKAIIQLKKVMK